MGAEVSEQRKGGTKARESEGRQGEAREEVKRKVSEQKGRRESKGTHGCA